MYQVTPERLIGMDVAEIRMTEDVLQFTGKDGAVASFEVYGDCCSSSYFHDFHGVEKLLENGPIIEFTDVLLEDELNQITNVNPTQNPYDEEVELYGYKLVTEHPEFGPQTSVFSFRNLSNGYYGGEMVDSDARIDDAPIVTTTVLETPAD